MLNVSLLIGGRQRSSSDLHTFDRSDPVTGQIASRSPAATRADAIDAANAAAAAFPAWSALGPSARREKLMLAATLLEQRIADFTETMLCEIGATAAWAKFNVELAASLLREAAASTTHITGQIIPSDKPGMMSYAIRQPVGVVLGIAPWNAALLMGIRAIAAPLACGNTVVLKASEICPATHRLIGDVMEEAGLGAGVVNIITNAPADASVIVETLIAHPVVRRVNFTGSTRVGRTIAQIAARHLKPALLELGGKAPFIVLDDADIDEAVSAAAFGAFMNQGQICMSTERIVLDSAVADQFAEKIAAEAATLIAGDPRNSNSPLGSVIGIESVERINSLVRDAVSKGAKILAGGHSTGTLMDATVLDHVTPAMRIYGEESFGPVVTLVRVEGVEEAIRVANDTEYGLSSAVFGRDEARAMRVARRLEAGICHINGPTVHDETQMPFGGMKSSGYGRFGGEAAIREFTELRWITTSSQQGKYPI